MTSLNDVLLAMSNIPVDDPIAEIWGRGLQGGGYTVRKYTGTLPITINANGQLLLDYQISGNTEQTGTPTPENPVDVVGCGERTVNLYNINAKDINNGYVNNAQLTQDGTVTMWESAEVSEYTPISGDTAYSFNGIGSYNSPCYALYDENKQLIGAYRYNGASIIHFTSPSDARYFRFTHIKTFSMAMLVEGLLPEYEPYGYKLPILSNSTVTNIYLGEVATTRRIKKLVLTGEEEFNKNTATSSNYLYYKLRNALLPNSIEKTPLICNELPVTNEAPVSQIGFSSNNNFKVIYVNFGADVMNAQPSGNTAAGLKEYLAAQYEAGTPVTIWYVLAEPETGIVNEPLMKIDKYADTVSMEQAGVSIPTIKGTTVIDYDGTPKPSEMYIKYGGKK